METRELFLDGNDLRCYGVSDLIRVVSQEAEKMAIDRQIQKNLKAEEEKRLKEAGLIDDEEKDGKKKKGKKKGSKSLNAAKSLVLRYATRDMRV